MKNQPFNELSDLELARLAADVRVDAATRESAKKRLLDKARSDNPFLNGSSSIEPKISANVEKCKTHSSPVPPKQAPAEVSSRSRMANIQQSKEVEPPELVAAGDSVGLGCVWTMVKSLVKWTLIIIGIVFAMIWYIGT